MKCILSFALLLFTTLFFGQKKTHEEPAIFIDSSQVATKTMQYMDPNEIESVNVDKKSVTINGKLYHGQIHITTKNPTKYDFISLDQIKSEFTKIKSNDVIYMINGDFIKEDQKAILLDRNYILEVEVTNSNDFYNLRESNTKFDIINILGKTKENLDAKNNIILRGHEAIGVK